MASYSALPEPMLARSGRLPASGDYAYEVKWDGFRAIVSTEGPLRVRSRRGRDMTEHVGFLAQLPVRAVLDGELVALDVDSKPDFPLLCAFLDDKSRIRADVNDRYERQANQAAIEILAQGDALRRQADDSRITFPLIEQLGDEYEISMQATARRIVEESHREVALAIAYQGSVTGKLMPAHLYRSKAFEERFRWQMTRRANAMIHAWLIAAKRGEPLEPIAEADIRGGPVTLELEPLRTPQAVFLLFRPH